ncbi:hypothetical protein LVJ94_31825 [Pendulispora rubella]|uniref:Uncharacterized protein n=1 Tax=Pendulispora rubella TaxID=2741070 RepID=A0ABZ2KWW2_9BACT
MSRIFANDVQVDSIEEVPTPIGVTHMASAVLRLEKPLYLYLAALQGPNDAFFHWTGHEPSRALFLHALETLSLSGAAATHAAAGHVRMAAGRLTLEVPEIYAPPFPREFRFSDEGIVITCSVGPAMPWLAPSSEDILYLDVGYLSLEESHGPSLLDVDDAEAREGWWVFAQHDAQGTLVERHYVTQFTMDLGVSEFRARAQSKSTDWPRLAARWPLLTRSTRRTRKEAP